MQELNSIELAAVNGGSNWETIGYEVGYAIGSIGSYIYNNMLMTDMWLDDINPT